MESTGRRLLLTGFGRAPAGVAPSQRPGAACRPREYGGRLSGGPDGPRNIARAACQRTGEFVIYPQIDAGPKGEKAGAERLGSAQAACTRDMPRARASTGLPAVELVKGAFGGRAGRPTPPGYRGGATTHTKGRMMYLVTGDAAAVTAAALVQAECSLRPPGGGGPSDRMAARFSNRRATIEAMYRHYLSFVTTGKGLEVEEAGE